MSIKNPYEDDNTPEGLIKYKEWEESQTHKLKSGFLKTLIEDGDKYIDSIEKRNIKKNKIKQTQIKYILNKSNEYEEQYLQDLFFDDVTSIYKKVKIDNKSIFTKLLEFTFGWEKNE